MICACCEKDCTADCIEGIDKKWRCRTCGPVWFLVVAAMVDVANGLGGFDPLCFTGAADRLCKSEAAKPVIAAGNKARMATTTEKTARDLDAALATRDRQLADVRLQVTHQANQKQALRNVAELAATELEGIAATGVGTVAEVAERLRLVLEGTK